MKAAFEALNTGSQSFLVRRFEEKKFSAPFHFHPEFELTLIEHGFGKRYVGAHMQDYAPGDLVLLGSNLPHCWKTEIVSPKKSESIVIQFRKDCLGETFFDTPELNLINHLLVKSNNGIHFKTKTERVIKKMEQLSSEKNSCRKLILLLEVLFELTFIKNYSLLNKETSYKELSPDEKERINTVMAYIVENFQKEISLKKAAASINLSTHAFCKYFKKITRKTFIEAVNDYRIDFATKQLVHTDETITAIGFNSGFNDISNFYKTFRQRTHQSPLSYRKAFIK
ncbi:MAG: AraC family transcriptional regulator [Bacteroidetes bacterium]|nr:AraC family transcriptional regulator [Bacteroidota bacterium]